MSSGDAGLVRGSKPPSAQCAGNKPVIEAAIFDLGGVLIGVDSLRGVRKLAASLPGQSEDEILNWFSGSEAARAYELGRIDDVLFYRESLRVFGNRYSFDLFSHAWTDIFYPIQCMIDLLAPLASRIQLFLLSNTNRMHIDFLVRRFSFFSLFRKSYYSHELHLRKPDAAIYMHVLKDAGLTPASCLFVDDRAENVKAAADCGLYACLYSGGTRVRCVPGFREEKPLQHIFHCFSLKI